MPAVAERDLEDRKLWDSIIAEKKIPGILHRALEGVWKYRDDPDSLRPLARVTQLTKEDESQRTNRQNRRDGRIAESWVLLSLVMATDLTSLRVGYPIGKDFVYRSCAYLSKTVGMFDEKSGKANKRYQRAFQRLQKSQLMSQLRRAETLEGGLITQKAAVKMMSESLLIALLGGTHNSGEALKKARGDKYQFEKAKQDAKPEDREEKRRRERDNLFASVEAKIAPKAKPAPEAAGEAQSLTVDKSRAEYQRARAAKQLSLVTEHGMDFKQVHEAMRTFPAYEVWAQ